MLKDKYMDSGQDAGDGSLATTLFCWAVAICSYLMSHLVLLMDVPTTTIFTLRVILISFGIISAFFAIAVNYKKGIAQMKEWREAIKKLFR